MAHNSLKMKKTLFHDDSSDDDNIESNSFGCLKINTPFANKYVDWKSKEEHQKLREKYGDEDLNSDTGSSTDDEYAGVEDPEFDKDIFRVLAAVETNNTKILNKDAPFYKDKYDLKAVKQKASQTVSAKDLQKQFIMMSEEKQDFEDKISKENYSLLENSNKSKKTLFNDDIESDDSDDETMTERVSIPKLASKTNKSENAVLQLLAGESSKLDNKEDEELITDLKSKWDEEKMSKKDKYLVDYFVHQRYLEEDDPNFERDEHHHAIDIESLSDDEKTYEKLHEYESKYRFRFEDPDQEFIKKYPRVMEDTLRKKDLRNKEERKRKKIRETEEAEKKAQEIKRFKALEKKEILTKIEALKETAGISEHRDMNFESMDIEADFDPETHDKNMAQLFDEDYYNDVDENEHPKVDEDIQHELELQYEKLEKVEAMDNESFKYATVVPNSFGLTTEEILMAKDTELNRWFSLKKALSLERNEKEETNLKKTYDKRALNEDVKKRILPSLFTENVEDAWEEDAERKRIKNKKKKESRLRKLERTQTLMSETDEKIEEELKTHSEPKQKVVNQTKTNKKCKDVDLQTNKVKSNKKLKNENLVPVPLLSEEPVASTSSNKSNETVLTSDLDISDSKNLSRRQRRNLKKRNRQSSSYNENSAVPDMTSNIKQDLKTETAPASKKVKFNPVFEPLRGISDERMAAYGNNPKKIKKKLVSKAKIKK